MFSVQFVLVTSTRTLFWAPRVFSFNLIFKETTVEKWLSLMQTRQHAQHVHLFFEIFDLFSHSFDLSQPQIFLLRAQHYLLFHESICVASTSSIRFLYCWLKHHSPSSLPDLAPCILLVVVASPWMYLMSPNARAMAFGSFLLFILCRCWRLFSWTKYTLKLSTFLLGRKS